MSNEGQRRNTILFVDDDGSYLETLGKLLEVWGANQWDVRLASSVAEGMAVLAVTPVDLVVTDLQMPVVDGLQFVQLLHRKYPRVPKVVLTSHQDPASRDACIQAGADLFLQKPTDLRLMEEIFEHLKALISLQTQEGFRGVLHKIGLTELIQLECLGYKSSVLEVSDAATAGEIFIREGQIVHATYGDHSGVDALNRMLAMTGGDFALKPFHAPTEEAISGPWEMLLMEAARLRDEASHAAPAETAPEVAPVTVDHDPAGPKSAEMLICGIRGEVIHAWKSPNADARLALFTLTRQWSQRLNQKLPLGRLQGFEATADGERLTVRLHDEWTALVRATETVED